LILLVSLSSCANIPNVPACIQLDIDKGYCIYTVENTEFYVNDNNNNPLGEPWFNARTKMIMLPSSSWATIKAFIIKKCRANKDCGANWEKNLDAIDEKLK